MNEVNAKVLLIGNYPVARKMIQKSIIDTRQGSFDLECVAQLSEGIERLEKPGIVAILLNLDLPDSHGIATFERLYPIAFGIPILILSDLQNENNARQAVQRGAQDYLLKEYLDSYTLPRVLHSVIGQKAAEDALFIEKERAEVTLNSIGDAVLSTNISGEVTYLNLVAEKMTGWRREEAVGRPLAEVFQIIDGTTRQPSPNPMDMAVRQNETVGLSANCILIRRDGFEAAIEDSAAPIHDRSGLVTGAVMVFHDVSASRAMTLKMSHSAQHDFLTDLPNRMLSNDRLAQSIAMARRHGKQLAVIFLDLDHLKHINDSLGHAIGDRVLQAVAQRLVACVRSSDTVSRQGGDEFVILLSEVEHAKDAAFTAEKMRIALTAPYFIEQHDLHVSVSMGISVYPDDGQDAETLIKCADIAMYHAKESGRDNFQFFRQDMNVRAAERQSVEGHLRRALERHEFVLHYQPTVNLATGAIDGAEALVRWNHPEHGLTLPAQFIPIAEDCGLIVPIGQWVLREACLQARAWLDLGLPFKQMSVNISDVEFHSNDFLDGVRAILRDTGLEPRYLELELTESVLMHDAASTSSVLEELSVMGVQLAIDDFGTGYSSLSYLRRFPIDTLKIDKSFVQDLTIDLDDPTIVSAVIAMGKSLKQRVIAEGVETRPQLEFLQRQHCNGGQGYYFSRPVVADAFASLLATGLPKTLTD
jgi:diguanylate cyclase (GGDEF)-like protein/PAS domain S-box-containing protein